MACAQELPGSKNTEVGKKQSAVVSVFSCNTNNTVINDS